MKQLCISFKIAMMLLICVASVASAEIYKWVDAEGNVHFSDAKPENQQVEKKHYDVANEKLDPEMVIYREQMDQQLQSLEIEKAIEKEDKALADKKALAKKRYCNQLKSNFIMDENISRVYVRDADGTRRALTTNEREKRRKEMKAELTKNCS